MGLLGSALTIMAEPPSMPLLGAAGKPKAAHPAGCCASMAADRMDPEPVSESSTDQSRLYSIPRVAFRSMHAANSCCWPL